MVNIKIPPIKNELNCRDVVVPGWYLIIDRNQVLAWTDGKGGWTLLSPNDGWLVPISNPDRYKVICAVNLDIEVKSV